MNESRDHFTFFKSFREQIDLCEEKDQLRLYRAITDFALFHKDTDFTEPLLNMAWIGIKPHLDRSWTKYTNATKSVGVPKPRMKGNKNAAKDDAQSEYKAKSKLNQSENKTIVMECNGMDSIESSSSIEDEEDIKVDWEKFADVWKDNSWSRKPDSPLANLQYGKVREDQKPIIVQRVIDCMKQYGVSIDKAKDMLFKVIKLAGDDTDKNNLRTEGFVSEVNFAWLFRNSKNFFDVLDGNYIKKR